MNSPSGARPLPPRGRVDREEISPPPEGYLRFGQRGWVNPIHQLHGCMAHGTRLKIDFLCCLFLLTILPAPLFPPTEGLAPRFPPSPNSWRQLHGCWHCVDESGRPTPAMCVKNQHGIKSQKQKKIAIKFQVLFAREIFGLWLTYVRCATYPRQTGRQTGRLTSQAL